ncbi:MAG: hypothetical protein J0L92_32740 [Deltaproteobacteria bacterium]|nr:hypothetical protein [Deltaproteobacteria bacterium]
MKFPHGTDPITIEGVTRWVNEERAAGRNVPDEAAIYVAGAAGGYPWAYSPSLYAQLLEVWRIVWTPGPELVERFVDAHALGPSDRRAFRAKFYGEAPTLEDVEAFFVEHVAERATEHDA